eukprot:531847_1
MDNNELTNSVQNKQKVIDKSLTKENRDLKQQLQNENLTTLLKKKNVEINNLKKKIATISNQLEEHQDLKDIIIKLQKQIDCNEKQLLLLQEKIGPNIIINSHHNTIGLIDLEKQNHKIPTVHLKIQNDRLKRDNEHLATKNNILNQLIINKQIRTTFRNVLENKYAQDIEIRKKEIKTLTKGLLDAERETDSLKQSLAVLEHENKSLRMSLNNSNKQFQNIKSIENINKQLILENDELRLHIESLEQEIDLLIQEIEVAHIEANIKKDNATNRMKMQQLEQRTVKSDVRSVRTIHSVKTYASSHAYVTAINSVQTDVASNYSDGEQELKEQTDIEDDIRELKDMVLSLMDSTNNLIPRINANLRPLVRKINRMYVILSGASSGYINQVGLFDSTTSEIGPDMDTDSQISIRKGSTKTWMEQSIPYINDWMPSIGFSSIILSTMYFLIKYH